MICTMADVVVLNLCTLALQTLDCRVLSGNNNLNKFISSPERKAQGELIVWDSSRRPSVHPSVRPCLQMTTYVANNWYF